MNVTQMTALIRSDMPWQRRYGEIASVVKQKLDYWLSGRDAEVSTNEVVESLMPLAICRGEQIEARSELFTILMKLAKHDLANYCHKGEPKAKKRFGKVVAPWIWHANRAPAKLDLAPLAQVLREHAHAVHTDGTPSQVGLDYEDAIMWAERIEAGI
jgi:hypothetical protein